MAHGHTYKKIEIVGTSAESLSDAIDSGLRKAAESVRHLAWFEVTELRGAIQEGQVSEYQVAMKVGLRVDE